MPGSGLNHNGQQNEPRRPGFVVGLLFGVAIALIAIALLT